MKGEMRTGDSSEAANTLLVGGRIRSERERLKLSQADAARLMGITEKDIAGWERADSSKSMSALTMLGHAGADVLFIITGKRNEVGKSGDETAAHRFREALERLPANERQRLLLYFVAKELEYVTTRI